MLTSVEKYNEIFDYLNAPTLPAHPEPAVVFGRNDALVADKLEDLIIPGLVTVAVISGGVGKDTGDLLERGYASESDFLLKTLHEHAAEEAFVLPPIFTDTKALNGRDNARNSVKILCKQGQPTGSMTAVAHATSAKRLAETLRFEATAIVGTTPNIHVAPTNYKFDASSQKDRDEAAMELLRLADWPEKHLLFMQQDLPINLVDFARDVHGDAPIPLSKLHRVIISMLPGRPRQTAIEFLARHGRK